ncbi:MAG TPA: hypothetical protein VLE47_00625 [Candidatus Saccharimonadales bacterium]|nr:hypothetical protein [Candidatus Saccharimonadales bacterium]
MENQDNPKNHKILLILLALVVIICLSAAIYAVTLFLAFNSPKTSNKKEFLLKVTSPESKIATSKKTVTIKGTSQTQGYITITSSQSQKIIKTENGDFSAEISLTEGSNVINITAFTKAGTSQSLSREVLYLDEDLTNL